MGLYGLTDFQLLWERSTDTKCGCIALLSGSMKSASLEFPTAFLSILGIKVLAIHLAPCDVAGAYWLGTRTLACWPSGVQRQWRMRSLTSRRAHMQILPSCVSRCGNVRMLATDAATARMGGICSSASRLRQELSFLTMRTALPHASTGHTQRANTPHSKAAGHGLWVPVRAGLVRGASAQARQLVAGHAALRAPGLPQDVAGRRAERASDGAAGEGHRENEGQRRESEALRDW